ncbi:MAG: NfeD family protein [Candidatus Faecousia sp.]|nr:NfeD family protein [Clostridiales bacterium]MDY6181108.1 NfeD family protein [Candidatus Faecousia sp.]
MMWNCLLWLGLLVLFLVAEGASVALVSVWFAAGSLVALIAALLGGPLWLQILLFVAVSLGLLAMLRPFVRKYLRPRISRTNVDAVVGTQGFVTEAIDNVAASGQVKLGAMPWTARSTSGEPIPTGTRIRVDRVEGVKVYVSPAQEPAVIQ